MEQTITKRYVDWSTLNSGFNIPVAMQPVLWLSLGRKLKHGESIEISVAVGSKMFVATLSNAGFDKAKFADHETDIVRVMYQKSSGITTALQELFAPLYKYMLEVKPTLEPRKHLIVPKEKKEQMVFSAIGKNMFVIEALDASYNSLEFCDMVSEEQFESPAELMLDTSAGFVTKERLVKIRKLDHSICDNLKKLYDYRCQMTGEKIGDEYGGNVVEAHHIVPFVESLDNDSSNIIIVSPNYHRIIHQTKPRFVRKTLSFHFPNGLIESVKLNKHLLTTKS